MYEKEFVLIFHGWEDNSKSGFIPELIKDLKSKGYESKAFDQPNTDAPKFEEWFEFVGKEIKKIGKDNISIVGHSMGGLLALKLSEKYKVKKLILVNPVGSKPSEDYFKSFSKDLDKEDLKVFRKYQDRGLDMDKIKQNTEKITFIFGEKDPWIKKEIRNFYIEKFKDIAEIIMLPNKGHMSEGEGVKKIPEIENLFKEKL